MHDWFKSYKNFETNIFQKKTSNVGIWCVYPVAIDTLSEPKNLLNWPHFLKCFWDQTSDMLAEIKSKCVAQYSSLLPLDRHPHLLMFEVFETF